LYAIFTSPKQILLDRGIELVVFGADCDRMVVGFITTYTISAYHHWCCEFESRSGRGVQHYVIKFEIWNIVESGVKHHKTNQPKSFCNFDHLPLTILTVSLPDLYSWNDGLLASMATDTGPTVATADCRSVSLPLVTSVKPVHVATTLLLSKLQSSCYKTDDKMFTE